MNHFKNPLGYYLHNSDDNHPIHHVSHLRISFSPASPLQLPFPGGQAWGNQFGFSPCRRPLAPQLLQTVTCSVRAAVHYPGPDVGLGSKSHPAWLRPPASLPRVPLLPPNSRVTWAGHLPSFVREHVFVELLLCIRRCRRSTEQSSPCSWSSRSDGERPTINKGARLW